VVFQAKAGFSLTKPRSLAEVVRKLKFPNNSIMQGAFGNQGQAGSQRILARFEAQKRSNT
jgi:hypothetical protein